MHAGFIGHPLASDGKYGDWDFNKKLRALCLKRMFLHAGKLSVPALRKTGEYRFSVPLPDDLAEVLALL